MERAHPPHSHHLRRGRVSEAGRIYLITATCANRQCFFQSLISGRAVVQSLQETVTLAETLCFVVMPDHIHWLIQLNGYASLDRVVGKVKARVTRRLRVLHPELHRTHIWQPGFHDRAIRRYEDLRVVARYVVANPIRAGLAETVGDYGLWDACWF
ncbi:MAG: transposase [Halomonadaceae bacterium]|nr:MAG: transposase [Halomonadaceae bacterium]